MADSPFFILLILSQNPAIYTHIVLSPSHSLTHGVVSSTFLYFENETEMKQHKRESRWSSSGRTFSSVDRYWSVLEKEEFFIILNRRSACGKRVFRSYVCTLCCYGYVGGYGIQFESRQKAKNCCTRNLFYYIYLLDEEATLCRIWKHAC